MYLCMCVCVRARAEIPIFALPLFDQASPVDTLLGVCLPIVGALFALILVAGTLTLCHRLVRVWCFGARFADDDVSSATIKERETVERLRALPTRTLDSGDPELEEAGEDGGAECALCLSAFLRGDTIRVLPCRHAFHCECVDRWLIGMCAPIHAPPPPLPPVPVGAEACCPLSLLSHAPSPCAPHFSRWLQSRRSIKHASVQCASKTRSLSWCHQGALPTRASFTRSIPGRLAGCGGVADGTAAQRGHDSVRRQRLISPLEALSPRLPHQAMPPQVHGATELDEVVTDHVAGVSEVELCATSDAEK